MSARERYKNLSNWVRGAHYAPVGDEIEMLRVCGLYNSKHNKFGLVRDHIFPRYGGYKHRVFPELLRHPANCRFIPQADNMLKAKKDYAVEPSEIEALFRRIEAWTGQWKEHQLCLELIRAYRRGDCYEPGSRKRRPRQAEAKDQPIAPQQPIRVRPEWPPSITQKDRDRMEAEKEFAEFTARMARQQAQLSAYEEARLGHNPDIRELLDRACAAIERDRRGKQKSR